MDSAFRNTIPAHPGTNEEMQNNIAKKATVIVCDDHIAIRAGIAKILESYGIAVVGECFAVSTLLELVSHHPNAIVITDLAVDKVPFPALVEKLHKQTSKCRIVVYSMRESPATIGLCYEAGASAFVPKRSEPEELIKAVESARLGERYFPPSVASNLANFHIDRNAPSHSLSAREMEIFLSFSKNETIEALAERLGISDKTVQNILTQISKKLDVPRTSFHQVAVRYGLLDF